MVHVVEGKYDRRKSIRGPGATDEAIMRLLERVESRLRRIFQELVP